MCDVVLPGGPYFCYFYCIVFVDFINFLTSVMPNPHFCPHFSILDSVNILALFQSKHSKPIELQPFMDAPTRSTLPQADEAVAEERRRVFAKRLAAAGEYCCAWCVCLGLVLGVRACGCV